MAERDVRKNRNKIINKKNLPAKTDGKFKKFLIRLGTLIGIVSVGTGAYGVGKKLLSDDKQINKPAAEGEDNREYKNTDIDKEIDRILDSDGQTSDIKDEVEVTEVKEPKGIKGIKPEDGFDKLRNDLAKFTVYPDETKSEEPEISDTAENIESEIEIEINDENEDTSNHYTAEERERIHNDGIMEFDNGNEAEAREEKGISEGETNAPDNSVNTVVTQPNSRNEVETEPYTEPPTQKKEQETVKKEIKDEGGKKEATIEAESASIADDGHIVIGGNDTNIKIGIKKTETTDGLNISDGPIEREHDVVKPSYDEDEEYGIE